jgi:hypothetical protein
MQATQRRVLGSCVLFALLAAPLARAENINVSRIATKFRSIDFAAEAALPEANDGATITYFTLAKGSIDTEPTAYFGIPPWTAAWVGAPTHPNVERVEPALPFVQGGATFQYSPPTSRTATADMASSPKRVASTTATDGRGVASAAATYSARIAHTGSTARDYFLELKVPAFDRAVTPAYDLCCSGDPNGGTYTYHRPTSAKTRAAVDLYADGLPIWSSESIYRYPELANGSPFDEQLFHWGKDAGPATSTLYLGRLSAGKSLTVSMVSRTNVNAKASDCGMEDVTGPFDTDPELLLHCLSIREEIDLKRGGDGAPVGFRIFSKVPLASAGGGGSPQ